MVCPQCGQDDIYVAVWSPVLGDIMECADCDARFDDPTEYDLPYPED